MELDYVSIGRRIKKYRIDLGLKQSQLAERSGVEPSNISHIERAATKVSLPTLVNIANALEVSLDEIVYDSLIKNEHISIKEINELLVDCEREELTALKMVFWKHRFYKMIKPISNDFNKEVRYHFEVNIVLLYLFN